MRGERGQASVEWIGLLLLVALALAAFMRLAPHPDGRGLAAAVLEPVSCTAAGGCARPRRRGDRLPARDVPAPSTAQTGIPFLRPLRGRSIRAGCGGWFGGRTCRATSRCRVRRAAVRAWQRAWLACLVYERVRYDFLHPESRIPGHRIPSDEILRMLERLHEPGRPRARLAAAPRAIGGRARAMSGERGQAGVEFVALVLLACLALGALASGVARSLDRRGFDGRSLGGFFARHFVCA